MDEEPKTNEESWTVEPPKKAEWRKNLRNALIAAALTAAVASVVYCALMSNRIPDRLGGVMMSPIKESREQSSEVLTRKTEASGKLVDDGECLRVHE
jgi:hypothetical protein